MAMRMAVMALRNAAAARMKTSSAIRLTHSRRSLSVIRIGRSEVFVCGGSVKPQARERKGFLLFQWRRRIFRQLVFAGVRALHLEFVEQQRRADNSRGHTAAAIADERIVTDGDKVASQG